MLYRFCIGRKISDTGLINHAIDDLIKRGFVKGLMVVLDSKPFKARCKRDPRNPSRDGLTGMPGSAGA